MRVLVIIYLYFGLINFGICQVEKINNGYNLEVFCKPPGCKYFKFDRDILYPQGRGSDWRMTNAEVAFKQSGSFLLTGDMNVDGVETGVQLRLEIEFFNINDEVIYTTSSGLIEYYSEPSYAEPIVVDGSVPLDIAKEMSYLSFVVMESQNLPYYELDTDCYGPCSNYQLNARIKAFKKLR